MTRPLYQDGQYTVTDASLSTPSRFYPIVNATAMIRRDPLWIGSAAAAICGLTLVVYGDLLFTGEKAAFAAIGSGCLLAGCEFRALYLKALGHRRVLVLGRRKRMRLVYAAIRAAHDRALTDTLFVSESEESSHSDQ